MEYNLIINQAALAPWIKSKKINLKDALIVGFIRGLNPDDPSVRRHMAEGYYLLTRSWMVREMPLLSCSEDRLGRRLKHLENVGLVDLISRVDEKHQYRLYGRLSKLYFQWEQKARQKVDEVGENANGENAELGENAHGRSALSPTVKTPTDHIKNDHEDGNGTAPSGGAVAVPPEDKNPEQFSLELLERQAEAGDQFALDQLEKRRREKPGGKKAAPPAGGGGPP